jgi:mRNA deadenylase 3'-5' endonuclease subunit Ccr4
MFKKNLYLGALALLGCTTYGSTILEDNIYTAVETDINPEDADPAKPGTRYKTDIEITPAANTEYKVNDGTPLGLASNFDQIMTYEKEVPGVTAQTKLWDRKYISDNQNSPEFKVMNFNMLAQGLSSTYDNPKDDRFGKIFDYADPSFLKWEVRQKQIIEEMKNGDADVIIVEENDRFDDIYRELNHDDNYEGIHMSKLGSPIAQMNGKPYTYSKMPADQQDPLPLDGVSIYWRTKTFEYNGKLKPYLEANRKRIISDQKSWNDIIMDKDSKTIEGFEEFKNIISADVKEFVVKDLGTKLQKTAYFKNIRSSKDYLIGTIPSTDDNLNVKTSEKFNTEKHQTEKIFVVNEKGLKESKENGKEIKESKEKKFYG